MCPCIAAAFAQPGARRGSEQGHSDTGQKNRPRSAPPLSGRRLAALGAGSGGGGISSELVDAPSLPSEAAAATLGELASNATSGSNSGLEGGSAEAARRASRTGWPASCSIALRGLTSTASKSAARRLTTERAGAPGSPEGAPSRRGRHRRRRLPRPVREAPVAGPRSSLRKARAPSSTEAGVSAAAGLGAASPLRPPLPEGVRAAEGSGQSPSIAPLQRTWALTP